MHSTSGLGEQGVLKVTECASQNYLAEMQAAILEATPKGALVAIVSIRLRSEIDP